MIRCARGLAACLAVLLLAALPLGAGVKDKKAAPPNRNIRFGMPAKTTADPENHDAYLIERPQYVLSYNDRRRIPNWVSWQVVQTDLGPAERGPFFPDPLLPKGFTHVKSSDYNGSGFDRGHMCPSGDRTNSEEDNDETFIMTNVIPQSPNNNEKAWERLETYCRDLVKQGKELHIACGPYGSGGFGKNGFAHTIGHGKVEIDVPARTWKVVLVLPKKGAEPTKKTRTIAVIVPNNQEVDTDWTKWRVSVRDVEKLTSFKFWPDLPDEVAESIKAAPDDTRIETPSTKLLKKKKKKKAGGED